MTQTLSDQRWFRPARGVLLLVINIGVAALVGLLVLRQFQIWSTVDTLPPICANFYGDILSCDYNDSWVLYGAVTAFCIVLFGSIWIERRRGWL